MTIQQIISTAYPAKASATKAFKKINDEIWDELMMWNDGNHEPSAKELVIMCRNKRVAAVVQAM
jgi:hypothetical protein